MGLVDRLLPSTTEEDERKIPVHAFMASMGELERGQVTREDIIAMFNLDSNDINDLDNLITKAQQMSASERFKFARELHDVLLLAEGGFRYSTKQELRSRLQG